jgi:hypothetical protein
MSFVYNSQNSVESFAEYQDIIDHDQRLFDTNEGLSESRVYPFLIRSTERILSKIKGSDWWKSVTTNNAEVNPDYIINNQNDFTDLCVYLALSEYVLPIIADFGSQDNAEKSKMQYYFQRSNTLLEEILNSGDWYDFDNDGQITTSEIKPGSTKRWRVR